MASTARTEQQMKEKYGKAAATAKVRVALQSDRFLLCVGLMVDLGNREVEPYHN